MNLHTIYARVLDAIMSVFDGTVDRAIKTLAKAELKLTRVRTRLDARIQREIDNQIASFGREQEAIVAERAARDRSRDRATVVQTELNRAERIQARISELLK